MIERTKDDSENIPKIQNIMVALILGSIVVWAAPVIVGMLTGSDDIFSPPDFNDVDFASALTDRITDIVKLVFWIAGIILAVGAVAAVGALQIARPPGKGRF